MLVWRKEQIDIASAEDLKHDIIVLKEEIDFLSEADEDDTPAERFRYNLAIEEREIEITYIRSRLEVIR